MSEKRPEDIGLDNIPEAVLEEKPERVSIVWLIPLVTLLIGAWLGYKAWSEMGPTVNVTFKSAEGLIAGKPRSSIKTSKLEQWMESS